MRFTSLPPVLGFTGVAGSGKSTAARTYINVPGACFIPMAMILKEMLRTMYHHAGMSSAEVTERMQGHLKDAEDPLLKVSPRWLMQTLGTEWGRNTIDRDWWVRLWRMKAQRLLNEGHGPIIVDDVRFENEAHTIMQMGGMVIGINGRKADLGDKEAVHASAGVSTANVWINNDSDAHTLSVRVQKAVADHHERARKHYGY